MHYGIDLQRQRLDSGDEALAGFIGLAVGSLPEIEAVAFFFGNGQLRRRFFGLKGLPDEIVHEQLIGQAAAVVVACGKVSEDFVKVG